MKILDHLEKAQRFTGTLERLDDRKADYEAIIWARMMASIHWMNAVVHAKGIIPENWDLNHTWYLDQYPDQSILEKIDDPLREALGCVSVYERIRTSHIRGPSPFGEEILKLADSSFEQFEAYCRDVLGTLDPNEYERVA